MTDNKQQVQTQLWNIANDLRGNMGADEFRDYILGLIFYKYLSDSLEHYFDTEWLKGEGVTYSNILTKPNGEQLLSQLQLASSKGYFIRPDRLFSSLVLIAPTTSKGHADLIRLLDEALDGIEQSVRGTDAADDFDKLFEELTLHSPKLGKEPADRNKLVGKILLSLDKIDFGVSAEDDILGDAYEYLISQFASGAGKKAGEFYTPQAVSTILARIVLSGKTELRDVYDPTCGSGSLLLRVAREVPKTATSKGVGVFYGQEMNRTTYNLARMNMIIHGVDYDRFSLKQEDTLERPQHGDQKFEAVVANPPFSANWSAESLFLEEPRFMPYGKLAPSSKADYAFITHMLYHLADDGIMAVVLPHGALFRGAAEGHIRKHIIKQYNLLDSVIGLPANIFYGTSIPTCIMVFRKDRKPTDSVLFIDASEGFEKAKNQNYLREEDINKIVTAYRERREEDKYSHNATFAELKENDYNLNIPRYVDTFEEEEQIDLIAVQAEIKSLDAELAKVEEELNNYLKELGL